MQHQGQLVDDMRNGRALDPHIEPLSTPDQPLPPLHELLAHPDECGGVHVQTLTTEACAAGIPP